MKNEAFDLYWPRSILLILELHIPNSTTVSIEWDRLTLLTWLIWNDRNMSLSSFTSLHKLAKFWFLVRQRSCTCFQEVDSVMASKKKIRQYNVRLANNVVLIKVSSLRVRWLFCRMQARWWVYDNGISLTSLKKLRTQTTWWLYMSVMAVMDTMEKISEAKNRIKVSFLKDLIGGGTSIPFIW